MIAHVVRVRARVEEVPDGLVEGQELPHLRQCLVRMGCRLRVDHQGTRGSRLHDCVPTAPGEQIHVPLDGQQLQDPLVRIRGLAHARCRGGAGAGRAHDVLILRVHRVGPAARRARGNARPLHELLEERVRPREVMRHLALRPAGYLLHVLAGPQPVRDVLLGLHEVRRANHRLGQVDRIRDDDGVRHVVAMQHETLEQRRLITFGHAVAAQPSLLQVRGSHGQRAAVPRAGRKTHEGVRREAGGVWPPVHPDGACLLVGADVVLDRNHLLCLGILFLPDPQVQGTVIDVGRHVHAALMFLQRQP